MFRLTKFDRKSETGLLDSPMTNGSSPVPIKSSSWYGFILIKWDAKERKAEEKTNEG